MTEGKSFHLISKIGDDSIRCEEAYKDPERDSRSFL